MRRLLSDSVLCLGTATAIAGCTAPDFETPCQLPPDVTDCQRSQAIQECARASGSTTVDQRLAKDLDILFVIDNSTSMSPKQKAIAQAIPAFMQKIDATRANYHIGVITTDIGTAPVGSAGFPGASDPRCNTVKGDDGVLQNKACATRIPSSGQNTEFGQACLGNTLTGTPGLCPDPSFVPSDLWIAKTGTTINVSSPNAGSLPASAVAERAFKCIGLVGDYGCGVESPLESMKRALDGHLQENKGFLRDNSVLAVIFITDEDDCSVQLAQRAALNPANASCDPQSPDPDYSCFNLDYRCIAKSIVCDEPMGTPGLKHNCREQPGNFLEPVDKYVKFLSGLRRPDRLVVAGIWTPSIQGFQARGGVGDGRLEIDTPVAGDLSTNLLNRGEKAKAACYDPDPQMKLTTSPKGFFGQAQLRLSSFIRRFDAQQVGVVERSICDATNYASALDNVASKVQNLLGVNCLQIKPAEVNGAAQCMVGYVDRSNPQSLPDAYLPQCSATCCQAWAGASPALPSNPTISAACAPEAQDCFCAVQSTASPRLCEDTAVAGVWRVGNAPLPEGKDINFRCAGAPATGSGC